MPLIIFLCFALSGFAVEVLTDGIIKKDIGLKPHALVETYLKKDSAGEFLHTMNWWNLAVACPNCGAPEKLTVITGYKMKKVSEKIFEVSFDVEGEINSGVFTASKKKYDQTFTVTTTKWGNKIDQKSQQMVYAQAVLDKFADRIKPESAVILKSLVKR
jgi:hypothetical protein